MADFPGGVVHCDLKVAMQALKQKSMRILPITKANNKCFKVLNVHVKGYRKAYVNKGCKI